MLSAKEYVQFALVMSLCSVGTGVSAQSDNMVLVRMGNSILTGEFLGVVNDSYHLQTSVGEVFVPLNKATCLGAACPPRAPEFVQGGEIALMSSDGTLKLEGKMIAIENGNYVVQTESFGEVKVAIDGASCAGPGCPIVSQ